MLVLLTELMLANRNVVSRPIIIGSVVMSEFKQQQQENKT